MAEGDPLPEFGAAQNLSSFRPSKDWKSINDDLKVDLDIFHHQFSSRVLNVTEAEEKFVRTMVHHLSRYDLLKTQHPRSRTTGPNRLSHIQKTVQRLAATKNNLRGSIATNPRPFLNAVRAHNKIARTASIASKARSTHQFEKKFQQNPFDFAKKVLKTSRQECPDFDESHAYDFFRESFSKESCTYAGLPDWIQSVMPNRQVTSSFDLTPVTPKQIKSALRKCSSKSSPGCNCISYYHLKHLPATHHFLATLFSRILLENHTCPPSWCVGKFTLIYKSGPTSNPGSFRPIALTSTIGKLFNRIIATRLEKFVLANGIIDPTIQKGFLTKTPGVLEHIYTTSAIVNNAKENGLPLFMTFLDLANAFGSISHRLIQDMLSYVAVPDQVTKYICDAYSKLRGFVSSSSWTTEFFPIERGVFQGDTLSPLIFLIAFNPIIELANTSKSSGFSLKYPVPSSCGLPPVDAHIYLKWDEPSSDEAPGWYRCQVAKYLPNGLTEVHYPNGTLEVVNLHTTQWHLATGRSKHYQSEDCTPPFAKVPKVREKLQDSKFFSTGFHRVKGYCDDLTLISSNQNEHKSTLKLIDLRCQGLDLHLKPAKCISLAFDGRKVVPDVTYALTAGRTLSISNHPTKFLGKVLADCPRSTAKHAVSRLKSLILPNLQKIDDTHIRGEYKTWILNYYLLPSIHFHLMVNDIPKSHIYSLQRKLTRTLKKWLNLPRCATPSILFHPNGLNLKFLPTFHEEAKMSLLSTVHHSPDPQVLECLPSLQDPSSQKASFLDPKTVKIFQEAVRQCQSESLPPKKSAVMKKAKALSRKKQINEWESHLSSLTVQNALLDIFAIGAEDNIWQQLLIGMPASQLSFVLRASCDSLPCPNTLVRWGYSLSKKCPLCNFPVCNVKHVLSCCSVALSDGRYTWRHNLVLEELVKFLKAFNPSGSVFADLPGHRACESPAATIPPKIIATSARLDIFIIYDNQAVIIELTVPWNSQSNIQKARSFKQNKDNYQLLVSDLSMLGYSVQLQTIEIGCLGHYTSEAYAALKSGAPNSKPADRRCALTRAAKTAISSSYFLFTSRHSPWSLPDK